MAISVFDAETGRVWDANHIQQAEALLRASKTKEFWEVVEMIVKMWIEKSPTKWQSYIIHLDSVKRDQKVKSGAWGKHYRGWSRSDSVDRRMICDFPVWILMMIKKLYPDKYQEISTDSSFYDKFARKFPVFAVFEKF